MGWPGIDRILIDDLPEELRWKSVVPIRQWPARQ